MKQVDLKAREIMRIHAQCPEDARLVVGENDFGMLRAICITGGSFSGEELNGVVVPGGADWSTGFGSDNPDDFTSVNMFAKYLLKTDDGVYIAIENLAKRDKTKESPFIVTNPRFFAPRGKYEWLNYGVYAANLYGEEIDGVRTVIITVYQLL